MRYITKRLSLLLLLAVVSIPMFADYGNNPLYYYVKTNGRYTNDGLSWENAKNNVQDAINELHDYMTLNGITEGGCIFVAKGTYRPTQPTDDTSDLPQYLSFKIYAGINVWGGWYGDEHIEDNSSDEALYDAIPKITIAGPSGSFVLNQFETIFDGNLSDDQNSQAKFVWKEDKQRYNTTFPSNVYHVVTFATNGFNANGRARALTSKASLNVVTVRGGHAYNTDASLEHPYNAYGGGVYMVDGSYMTNCRISECEASRDGGGLYMDGGGNADHNIVTDCQALGLGIKYGRGGGICIDQAGVVEQSYMINNVSREGAGLGIYYNETTAHSISQALHTYSAVCKASLIANNSALSEAGGAYLDGGGVLDGVSVVRNRCNGIGALVNGIVSGQSSGVFTVGPARIYNSVLWGSQVGENTDPSVSYESNYTTYPSDSYDDIQYAGYVKSGETAKSHLGYVAMNNSDMVNWSYSTTNNIISLATLNAFNPNQDYTVTLANSTGKRILLASDDEYLYGSNNQNMAMGTFEEATAMGNAVVAYKIEKIGDTNTYRFRCVTPSGEDYALWGKSICYLNSQDHAGGVTFNLGENQDFTGGHIWEFEEISGGYKIKCKLADNSYVYLDGTTVQTTSEKVWKIHLVDEETNNASKKTLNYVAFLRGSGTAGVMANLKNSMIKGLSDDAIQQMLAGFNPSFTRIVDENGVAYTDDALTALTNDALAARKSAMMLQFVRSLSDGMFFVSSYSFRPLGMSALAGAGVQLSDLDIESGVNLSDALLTKDVLDIDYSPLCDLGCYNAQAQSTLHASSESLPYLETNIEGTSTLTVFVDPNRSSTTSNSNVGSSWDAPFMYLRDALHYVWDYKTKAAAGTSGYTQYTHFQVLCKEGTYYTAATATNERVSASSIYMIDGVSVYGGFPNSLTGTQLSNGNIRRNPTIYPSIISGSIFGDDYAMNVGHLVNFCSVSNAVLDGFQLRYGNASGSVERNLGALVSFDGGAGIVMSNLFKYDGVGLADNKASIPRMTGNVVRNCIVAGCTARSGAGLFTYYSGVKGAADFTLENCIFHNNSVIYGDDHSVADNVSGTQSIINIVAGVNLTMHHCDILRNIGYGISVQSGATLNLYNSMIYANLDRAIDNTNEFDSKIAGASGYAKLCAPIANNGGTVNGSHNMFDYLFSSANANQNETSTGVTHYFSSLYNYGTANIVGSNNQANLTYSSSAQNNTDYNYPLFKNATKNSGVSTSGDITFFGNNTSFMPNSMSPLTNGGAHVTSDTYLKDMTAYTSRVWGGSEDLGAVENDVDQPTNPGEIFYKNNDGTDGDASSYDKTYKDYKVLYVRNYSNASEGGDGSSWNEAINGNALYNEKTGLLALGSTGDAEITTDMVEVYNVVPSTGERYRLKKTVNSTPYYMGTGGEGTTNCNLASEFVFVKTSTQEPYESAKYDVYKFYFYHREPGSEQGTYQSVEAGYLKLGATGNVTENFEDATGFILVGSPSSFKVIPVSMIASKQCVTFVEDNGTIKLNIATVSEDHLWTSEKQTDNSVPTQFEPVENVIPSNGVKYRLQNTNGYYMSSGGTGTQDINMASEFMFLRTNEPDVTYLNGMEYPVYKFYFYTRTRTTHETVVSSKYLGFDVYQYNKDSKEYYLDGTTYYQIDNPSSTVEKSEVDGDQGKVMTQVTHQERTYSYNSSPMGYLDASDAVDHASDTYDAATTFILVGQPSAFYAIPVSTLNSGYNLTNQHCLAMVSDGAGGYKLGYSTVKGATSLWSCTPEQSNYTYEFVGYRLKAVNNPFGDSKTYYISNATHDVDIHYHGQIAGHTQCTTCSGNGTLSEDCHNCTNGVVLCSTCHGNKTVTCSACNGSGKVNGKKCGTCNGKKTVNCSSCSGNGLGQNETCSNCNGSGKTGGFLGMFQSTCDVCKGNGKYCPSCKGTLKITSNCTKCNGTGELNTVTLGEAVATSNTLMATTNPDEAAPLLMGGVLGSNACTLTVNSDLRANTSFGYGIVDDYGDNNAVTPIYYFSLGGDNNNWLVTLNTTGTYPGTYSVSTADRSAYSCFIEQDGNKFVSLTTNASDQEYWQLEPIYRKTAQVGTYLTGLQYAINCASAATKKDIDGENYSSNHQVWVAAGTYYGGIEIKDGADVLGGYPGKGSPGESERDISNTDAAYKTIIDAQPDAMTSTSNSRAVYQADTFTKSTLLEGLTFTRGYLDYGNDPKNLACQGAGMYLQDGVVVKNCLITNNNNNAYHAAGIYMNGGVTVKNSTISKNITTAQSGFKNPGGAGVYMTGDNNVLINSLIVENESHGGTYSLGAACYVGTSGTFYNCTVAYNWNEPTGSTPATGGFWDNSKTSKFYNCIFWGNTAKGSTKENYIQVGMPGFSSGAGNSNANFFSCYHSAPSTDTASDEFADATKVFQTESGVAAADYNAFLTACHINSPFNETFTGDVNGHATVFTTDYSLKDPTGTNKSIYCVNKGEEMVNSVNILTANDIDEDIVGENRVQDCKIDKGAYEYNGASNITPFESADGKTATYYVSYSGDGDASASEPTKAACMEKLQHVLDAAGRYKYKNPTHTVRVLLAGNESGLDTLKYIPTREVDPMEKDNDRSWSLMVPRGVLVYGGYNAADYSEETRSVLNHRTVLDGTYKKKGSTSNIKAYHVVTFTDRVYDPSGMPYLSGDAELAENNGASSYSSGSNITDESLILSMGNKFADSNVSDYSVLDGLFLQHGQADGVSISTSATKNLKGYGGAAVVPSYGSIRNCIIRNNEALYGGGGLFLQKGATVCGTLIKDNEAQYGGGVYFDELSSTPVWENFSTVGGLSGTVMSLAQLVYSTVVNNKASVKGGGIYYQNNARVVSSVIWGNTCGDQANVAGQTSAYSFANADEITFAKYPFSYSAVENSRLAGANNISVASQNENGVRFLDRGYLDKLANFATTDENIDLFYRISDFSQLAKAGSSVQSFKMAALYSGATTKDYNGVARISEGFDYVDIGACAIQQTPRNNTDITKILPRLYVAQASDINTSAQQAMLTSNDDIYKQKGSSFAYPFQTLDEALEYIRNLRLDNTHVVWTDNTDSANPVSHYVSEYAKNIPFEIVMGKGTFYPTRDIYNVQGESLGNTFLIPEGVTIVGGFDVRELTGGEFYGQSYKVRAHDNNNGTNNSSTYNAAPTETDDNILQLMYANLQVVSGDVAIGSFKIKQTPLADMKNARSHSDNNANNLIEPWEFKYQTILSGKVINADNAYNTYHVITVMADEECVGKLPMSFDYSGYVAGKKSYQKGAPVELNGIEISDGQAYRFVKTAANGYIWKDYYHGGGMMVDGNWFHCDYKNDGVSNAVAYRNIPIIIDRCFFTNNIGGYGGAISSNADIYLSNTSFASNQALAYMDARVLHSTDGNKIDQLTEANLSKADDANKDNRPIENVYYPGNGGAIYSTKLLVGANCMFENNEATNTYDSEPTLFNSPRSLGSKTYQFGGCGGAVYSGSSAIVQFFNCNFVRNKANMYPCIFARYPNHYKLGTSVLPVKDASGKITNSSVCTSEPASAYNKVIGSVFWGNQGTNTKHKFSANMIMASAPLLTDAKMQSSTPSSVKSAYALMPEHVTDEENVSCSHTASSDDYETNLATYQACYDTYAQSLWFCAYEEHTHMTPHRDYDIRLCDFTFSKHVERSIRDYVNKNYLNIADSATLVQKYVNQDYNQIIHSENSHINGPNFTKPSLAAGLAGYTQDADWMPKRINRLTDNGWGYIVQLTQANYPDDYEVDSLRGKVNPDGVIYAESSPGNYIGDGAFFTVLKSNAKFQNYIAMGDGTYMMFDAKNVVDESNTSKIMHRISKMPTPTVPTFDNQESYAYIDIGVFEFQHQRLGRPIGDVDYIWVAPAEKPENGGAIGTSWLRPTSDIQRAIETLLSNRNGHKKTLYIVEGDYKPFYTLTPAGGSSMKKNAGFTINTENLNSVALSPSRCTKQDGTDLSLMSIESLTILGGFSSEVQTSTTEVWKNSDGTLADNVNYNNVHAILDSYSSAETYRNSENYPTTFYSDNDSTHTLLDIVDARQWLGRAGTNETAPYLDVDAEGNAYVIPITIDGIAFSNTAVSENPRCVGSETDIVGSAINYATIEKYNQPVYSFSVPKQSEVVDGNAISTTGGSYTIHGKTGIAASAINDGTYALKMDSDDDYVILTFSSALVVGQELHVSCYCTPDVNLTNTYGITVMKGSATGTKVGTLYNTRTEIEQELVLDIDANMAGQTALYLKRNVIDGTGYDIYLLGASLLPKRMEAAKVAAPKNGAMKLTISRCKFYGNGTTSADIPAVNIAAKGGPSLIYNSLFHSNNGTAIKGHDLTLVNNTVALNKKGVNLAGTSKMFSSALWKNGSVYSDEVTGIEPGTKMQYNAISRYALQYQAPVLKENPTETETQEYNTAKAAYDALLQYRNEDLGLENLQIMTGPNFVDPENSVVADRNFHLRPSMMLLNALRHEVGETIHDDCSVYYNNVTGGTYNAEHTSDNTNGSGYWDLEKDLSYKSRKMDNYVDLGAYEYQSPVKAYAFYNPNISVSGNGDSWETAYGYGKLQTAIDMVCVATLGGIQKKGYVFAKGGRDNKSTNEDIIVRNNVQVYGSIASGYLKEPRKDENLDVPDANLISYVKDVVLQRPGIAGPTTDRTIIKSLSTASDTLYAATEINGFEVSGGLSLNPILKNEGSLAVNYSIIEGGSNSSVEKTLLYNDLFKESTLTLGASACAVNVTSELAIGIANVGAATRGAKFSCSENRQPTSVLNMDDNLEFQLPENHADIDQALAGNLSTLPANYSSYIHYETDRDLLGNPRKIGDQSDKGAFELWTVPASSTMNLTYTETIANNEYTARNRFFPQEGSFVYLGEHAKLIANRAIKNTGKLSILPGYLKMYKGSSVYGQGNSFKVNMIEVQKSVNVFGEIISFPFGMNYKLETSDPNTPNVYRYDGDRRATRDNDYQVGWVEIKDNYLVVPANEAVRFQYSSKPDNTGTSSPDFVDLWFTKRGSSIVEYIYEEEGDRKTVALKKHDIYGSTTQEDMGWNCFGSPYLVSNYFTSVTSGSPVETTLNMNIPHLLYEYHYPETSGRISGSGSYREVNSWEQYNVGTNGNLSMIDPFIILGEGVFTQTATFDDYENLVFMCPVPNVGTSTPVQQGQAPDYRYATLRHTYASEEEVSEVEEELREDEIRIYVKKSELHVEGLWGGERIVVCNMAGRVEDVHVVEDNETEYVTYITPGAHAVRVDNQSVVIMNHAK